jgi:hypothetical protein
MMISTRKRVGQQSGGSQFDSFLLLLEAHQLPRPEVEFLFARPRKFRADYCWPTAKVIVEREGGIWQGGRTPRTAGHGHSAGRRILADMEKGNVAQVLGFRYLRFTPQQLDSGRALPLLAQLLLVR